MMTTTFSSSEQLSWKCSRMLLMATSRTSSSWTSRPSIPRPVVSSTIRALEQVIELRGIDDSFRATPEEQAALNVLLEEYKTTLGEIGKETKAQLERRQAFEKVERQIADIQDEAAKINKTKTREFQSPFKDNFS